MPGRRVSPNVAAGAIIVILLGAVLLWQRPWADARETPESSISSESVRDQVAAQLRGLERATTASDFVRAAGDSDAARIWATRTYDNLQLVDADGLSLRYLRGGAQGVREDGDIEADVTVSWRPSDVFAADAPATSEATVTLIMTPLEDGTLAIRGSRPQSGAMPVWLVDTLSVERDGDARVVALGGTPGDETSLRRDDLGFAAAGVRSVRRIVEDTDDQLTVVVPANGAQAAALLGQEPASISQIAAVTSTIDNTDEPDTPIVVVVNPPVFDRMGDRAAQVVLSHEATHALTDVVGQQLETWVVEGFADFVALDQDDQPLSVSAKQIIAQVDTSGPPQALPSAADFDNAEHGLGATYEASWLIFRMLGETRSDADIVGFYDAVRQGADVGDATSSELGLTVAELTDQWRDYLLKSAST